MAKVLSLYEMAASKGRVIRQGEIVQMVMDGAGAFVCSAQEFVTAQKWGMSRTGSGNITTDRGRLLDKIEVLISRPNSFVATRGSSVPIERLAKTMKQNGYDLKEWNISRDVIAAIDKRVDHSPLVKKSAAEEPAADPVADPAAEADDK